MTILKILIVFLKLKCIELWKFFVKEIFPLFFIVLILAAFFGCLLLVGIIIYGVWCHIGPVSAEKFASLLERKDFYSVSMIIGFLFFVIGVCTYALIELVIDIGPKFIKLIQSNWAEAKNTVLGEELYSDK